MDDRTFRHAMGKFMTGVTVITTAIGTEVHGMTANAFMSVSINPNLISISIDERAKMLGKIEGSQKFAVSILGNDQLNVSKHFAGQVSKEDVFDFDWVGTVPVIQNALASIVCDVYESYKVGDHTIFIGKVTELHTREGNPLTFYEGKYGVLEAN